MIERHNGTRSFSIKTQRGIRIVHEHRIRKSWADEQFAVDSKEDNEFEDLLDDLGRVDGIFDGKSNWSQVMKDLLMTDPYRGLFLSHARALLSAVRGLVMSSVAGEVSCHREGKWGRLA